jgi:hypothetical protein
MVYGQEPVTGEAAQRAARFFQPNPAERPLACEVRPVAPALSYRLVYRAGYSVTAPMGQFAGQQSTLGVLVRITPKRAGARPLLLRDTGTLPAGSGEQEREASKFEAQVEGGFYLGAGKYQAELVLMDSQERVCRRRWDLEVKLRNGVRTTLPPGGLTALSQLDRPRSGTRAGSVTIFLHAGSPRGNPVLLASLAAIVERMPFSRVQVAVFSLDQHKELLRQNVADGKGFRRVAKALNDYNPGIVSYRTLQDSAGHRELLWQLLAKEALRAEPPDVAVFVGYSTFDDSHVFVPPACADGSRKTLYAYFNYAQPSSRRYPPPDLGRGRVRGPWGPGYPQARPVGPEMPDAISRITRACSGKVFPIHSPEDLAGALQKTAELLRGR